MRTMDPKIFQEILNVVNTYAEKYGRSPSMTVISKGIYYSRSTAYRYLKEMDRLGMVQYTGKEIITREIRDKNLYSIAGG